MSRQNQSNLETETIPNFSPMQLEGDPQKLDVIGKAKDFLDKLEVNIGAEEIFNAMGTKPEKTFLLYGFPGTGKSMCVQAFNNFMNDNAYQKYKRILKEREENISLVKNEKRNAEDDKITFNDLNLITFPYDIGNYGTAYINMGSRIVQSFFDTCFGFASLGKKVLIAMDEFDSLGASRKQSLSSGHAEDRKVLETIIKNLQKVHDTPNMYGVFMTNEPSICDEAVLRAGRIDERYFFDLPDERERKAGFRKAISNINKKAGYNVIRGYRFEPLVELSKGFNYADIFQSVERAVKQKAKDIYSRKEDFIVKAGKVGRSDLEKAVKEHKESFKSKKKIGFN